MAEKTQLPLGKISPEIFEEVIYPRLGAGDPRVLVGPRSGVDAAIVDVAPGRVMAVTTDPFYVVPAYGWERAAWFAVHILASDLGTTAIAPQMMSIDLNLPVAIDRESFERL
ncbi:MAG TPA: AIR synthase, partial [Acidobacteriota bacterium]|nr:AIR synthase [Acidobacteriota bacterium]